MFTSNRVESRRGDRFPLWAFCKRSLLVWGCRRNTSTCTGLSEGLEWFSGWYTPSSNEKAPQRSRNNVEGHGRNKNKPFVLFRGLGEPFGVALQHCPYPLNPMCWGYFFSSLPNSLAEAMVEIEHPFLEASFCILQYFESEILTVMVFIVALSICRG